MPFFLLHKAVEQQLTITENKRLPTAVLQYKNKTKIVDTINQKYNLPYILELHENSYTSIESDVFQIVLYMLRSGIQLVLNN